MIAVAVPRSVTLLAAVLALDSADKATVGAIAPQLEDSLRVSNAEIGLLVSASSFITALTTIPCGALVDRVCRSRLLVIGVLVWSTAMVGSGLAGSYLTLLVAQLGLGATSAIAGPAVASLTGDFFPAGERARIYGLILAGELVGAGLGLIVSGNVAGALSWHESFYALAVPGLALAWCLWRWLPEPARMEQAWLETPGSDDEQSVAQEAVAARRIRPQRELVLDDAGRVGLWRAVAYTLSVRTNLVLIAASTLGYAFLAGLRTFAVVFARQHYGLSQAAASSLLPIVGVGAVAGVLAGGRAADGLIERGVITARLLVPAAGLAAAAVVFVPALLLDSIWFAMPLLVLGAAALSTPNPPLDAARLDVIPPQLWGRAESVRTAFRTVGEAVAPLLFGEVSVLIAGGGNGGGFAPGKNAATAVGLQYTLLLMLVPLLVGSLVLLYGRRRYPRDVATAAASARPAEASRGAA